MANGLYDCRRSGNGGPQTCLPAACGVARGGRAEIEEARRPLDGHPIVTACASTFFLGKPQICGKQHIARLPLSLIIYSPFANS